MRDREGGRKRTVRRDGWVMCCHGGRDRINGGGVCSAGIDDFETTCDLIQHLCVSNPSHSSSEFAKWSLEQVRRIRARYA